MVLCAIEFWVDVLERNYVDELKPAEKSALVVCQTFRFGHIANERECSGHH